MKCFQNDVANLVRAEIAVRGVCESVSGGLPCPCVQVPDQEDSALHQLMDWGGLKTEI